MPKIPATAATAPRAAAKMVTIKSSATSSFLRWSSSILMRSSVETKRDFISCIQPCMLDHQYPKFYWMSLACIVCALLKAHQTGVQKVYLCVHTQVISPNLFSPNAGRVYDTLKRRVLISAASSMFSAACMSCGCGVRSSLGPGLVWRLAALPLLLVSFVATGTRATLPLLLCTVALSAP